MNSDACTPGPAWEVVIYTRQGCHLCDDAAALLIRYGLRPQMVDIDESPELLAKYTNCVPVVWIDGKLRFRGRVNESLLRRLLSAAGWSDRERPDQEANR